MFACVKAAVTRGVPEYVHSRRQYSYELHVIGLNQ